MRKILIVDDNPDILQVMQLLLGSRGFLVEVTMDGKEIFSKIESFQPGLIFLDIFLSGMDGRDLCKQIKSTDAIKHLPIILFSANKVKNYTVVKSKADAFISKPFDIHDLLIMIDSILPETANVSSMIA